MEQIREAIIQMYRLGNELNWEPPIDQKFVDALNGLRALLEDNQGEDQNDGPPTDGGFFDSRWYTRSTY